MQVQANSQQAIPLYYEKAQQVPQQCVRVAQILTEQTGAKEMKAVLMDSVTDAKVFEIFSENALAFTGGKVARLFSYLDYYAVGMNSSDKNLTGKLERVITLSSYRPDMTNLPGFLETAYGQVYHAMCQGWVESKPEDYPNIFDKQDPEKFALFVKKKSMISEDTLIRCLTRKFGLIGQVFCSSEWIQNYGGGYETNDLLYMWIDKKGRSTILEKFGIHK